MPSRDGFFDSRNRWLDCVNLWKVTLVGRGSFWTVRTDAGSKKSFSPLLFRAIIMLGVERCDAQI